MEAVNYPLSATPDYTGSNRHAADLVHDGHGHQQQSDVQYGGRPGWPHQSVGVPDPAGGAYRPTPTYAGTSRHAADLVHDDNRHQRQSDVQYRERLTAGMLDRLGDLRR